MKWLSLNLANFGIRIERYEANAISRFIISQICLTTIAKARQKFRAYLFVFAASKQSILFSLEHLFANHLKLPVSLLVHLFEAELLSCAQMRSKV